MRPPSALSTVAPSRRRWRAASGGGLAARLSALALALALVSGGGCGGNGATALLVRVLFDDAAHHPQSLDVTIAVAGTTLRMDAAVKPPAGRTVRSGDSFAVLLDAGRDAQLITVAVSTVEDQRAVLHGSGTARVVAGSTVPLAVPLDSPVDGGAGDEGPSDAGRDAPTADGNGLVDQAARDLGDATTSPDLSTCNQPNTVACNPSTGIETRCSIDGVPSSRACPYGCSGNTCLKPAGCAAPGDVTAGGVFVDDSKGAADDGNGSCAAGGADVVTVATVSAAAWRTLIVDATGTSYANAVFVRHACADPASELPLEGPCPGAASSIGTACSNGGTKSRIVACGLPPGSYYPWLDAVGAPGPYHLAVSLTPVDLNTCSGAGNLLAGGTYTTTTLGHANNFHASTLGCGDTGNGSRDAVFFLATTATHTIQLSTSGSDFDNLLYVRQQCDGPDLACSSGGKTKVSTVTLPNAKPGLYYVIVDGNGGAQGKVVITATLL